MQLWVQRFAGKKWPLDVPEHDLEVTQLRGLIAAAGSLPADRLKLLYKGKVLQDGDKAKWLKEDDTIVVVVAPLAPTLELSHMAAGTVPADEDDDDDVERFRIRRDAGPLERRLAAYLQYKLRVPPLLLTVIFGIRPRTYLLFLLWLVGCPIAARLQVGPVYVLTTLLAIIYCNLGRRQAGEASAYSIFNGGRELPGALNAAAIDDQMRRGQM